MNKNRKQKATKRTSVLTHANGAHAAKKLAEQTVLNSAPTTVELTPAAALAEMNPALRRKFNVIAKLSRDLFDAELLRFRIGAEVVQIKGAAKKYGTGAVHLLAAALGCDENTLYRYARFLSAGRRRSSSK